MRLHPWALAAWSCACLVVALAASSPVYRVEVLVAGAAMLAAGRSRPGLRARPLFIAIGVAGLGAIALNLLLSHTGATVLATVPSAVPLLGGPITFESGAFGAATGLAIAAGVLAVAPLAWQLEPDELLDAVPRHLERTGAALATTIALAPGLARSYRAVREAQTMRGWRPRGVRSWADVLVPVALTAMEDSLLAAEAMEARAFGAGPRTRSESVRWSPTDLLALGAAALAAAVFIGARVAGLPEDWLTYPTLAAPPTDPPLILAAGLLSVPPILVWLRSRG
jgi:energy-coupling factor transport system permease protein